MRANHVRTQSIQPALVGVFILPRTWLVLRERFKIGHVALQVEGRDIDEDLLQSEH